ncbi:HAD-IIA family hydrolase [Natrarchaeobius oligotrophus]|uniref:HAD-IIA family hydrolase n=1 Tax=Natrarchaeobius chitinivorans TaxID=1679083 RepID=A0A3N6PKD5_NATCH|nr:HAD-IIA family hydrolase [Natrarchaeobius chitinivorans]RQG99175.1 HAD-IIA family hydrolase [Natrarchaeobius chitinivorans]
MKAALIDLDGTVWRGERLIDGAASGLGALRDAGLPIVFFTNADNLRPEQFVERLESLGLDGDLGSLVTAGSATASYVVSKHPDAKTFVLGPEELHQDCRDAGVQLVESGEADVVVAGRTLEFDMDLLARTLDVFTEETVLLAPSVDRTHPVEDGERPGAGAIVSAVTGMTGTEPTVVGKPSPWMADIAADSIGVDPSDCLIVGDRLESDIQMGADVGMTTALVLTGATDRSDLRSTESEGITPDHVLESLGDVEDVLS